MMVGCLDGGNIRENHFFKIVSKFELRNIKFTYDGFSQPFVYPAN